MGFRKKNPLTPQKEPEASASTTVSVLQKETDWVSNAFQVAELASAAGGLLPFPYLKGVAELVKTLLKPIQQMQQNQDDYKNLAIKITTILQILYQEIKQNHETASDSFNNFEKDCESFYRYLQHIANDLRSFNKPYKSKLLRRYFAADREKDLLARHQSQIDECRINLMLRAAIRQNITDDSDFEKIRLGDLNVVKNILNGQAEHWEVRWKQESQTRMVRVYKGRDAIPKFKAEKELHSRYHHPNVLQLFGTITSKESPGLVFHNPWCIPIEQFNPKSGDALGRYIDKRLANTSYFEGCFYVEDGISQHAIISWQDLGFSRNFIGFKDREDGYLASCYVNVLDGRGLVLFEWSPNILQVIPASQWTTARIDIMSGEELTKITERVHLSEKSNDPLDPSFLWDLYHVINVFIWKDVSRPTYSVRTGDILLADRHNDTLDASNASILGFIPCEETSSLDWFVRNKILHKQVTVKDCGEHFRIRVPVDTAGTSATDDLQTVVIECDVGYPDRAASKRLACAYVSQIGCLLARTDGMHKSCKVCARKVCVVIGFSWHIQFPSKLRCSVGTFEYKELYFFISKPAVRDETLDTYWSLDPLGSERLYYSDMEIVGFNSNSFRAQTRRTLRVLSIGYKDFEFIQEAHAMLDIDPESDEGDVSDNSDQDSDSSISYHTAEDEAGDVEVENGGANEAEGGSVDVNETE